MDNNIIWHNHRVIREDREKIKAQRGVVLWFTGVSGSGKSTIANEVEYILNRKKFHTYLLDGDNVRHGLNNNLGFSDEDRSENIRRVSEVSKLFLDAGLITITAFISPFMKDREMAKNIIGDFIEIFIDTPIEECIKRDPKGLYKKAIRGEIKEFTGISSPYEPPLKPDIHIDTTKLTIKESANLIVNFLRDKGYIDV